MFPITMDVTLRDGGYRNNFSFSPEYALSHIKNISDAGIDWIEVGYRNGSSVKKDGLGITGRSRGDYLRLLSRNAPDAHMAVMFHPRNVTHEDIDDIADSGVGMVRICLDKADLGTTLNIMKYAGKRGLKTTLNITRMSFLSLDEIKHYARCASDAGVNVVYLADSIGSLGPDQITKVITFVRENISCAIGFHAHDNLGCALINSAAAYRAGATFIDSSLKGMGKGVGNLKTEFWARYINNITGSNRINYSILLDQVKFLEDSCLESRSVYSLESIVAALCDRPLDELEMPDNGVLCPSAMIEKISSARQSRFVLCAIV